MIQREDQDHDVMMGIGENTSFVKKLLARDDDFGDSVEVNNGRDPGVGVAFAWEHKPGISRFNVDAANDSSHSIFLNPPPPFQAREYIEENSSGSSSTTKRKWALFHKILDILSRSKEKKKSKHVVGKTSTRISDVIMPARRSILKKSHSIHESFMPRKSNHNW